MKNSLGSAILKLLFSLAICFSFNGAYAQDSKGTEFWICFPGNESSPNTQLYITAEQASTVTISIPGIAFNQVVNVAAGGLQVVTIPGAAQVQSQFVVENKGIRITATTEVTVYGMNAQSASTDAFLAFPVDALGASYYVLGYNRDFSFALPTQATIVATQNNTTVTITTTVTGGGFTAGVPANITLQQGQVYQLRSLVVNADYSGTRIVSDKPVSVFGGAQCTNISGSLRACDHLVEQLPPLSSWGRSFVTVPLATRTAGDVFRFLAQRNGTTVSVNGVVVATLAAGQFHERILGSTTYNRITSNEPILVGQYSRSSDADGVTSDPFFALVPPDEQFLNAYTISAGTANIPNNFVNIASPTANIGTVRIDNIVVAPGLWNPIPGTSFSGAKVPVSVGVHRIISALPIGVLVYGFGSFDSYGYLGGQSFSPVATVTSLVLTPETGTAPVGVQQCFDALVKDQFGVPVVGVRVDFAVTGVNPGAGFANTNASGIAQFCYTGANAGADNIVASIGAVSDASSFTWTPVVVSNIYYSKPTGDLHNVLTWGLNPDGSGANPTDFGTGKTFQLANRPGIYTMTAPWAVEGTINIPAVSELQINGSTLSIASLAGPGTLTGSLTSTLNVGGTAGGIIGLNFSSGGGTLSNLTINRTGAGSVATIGTALSLFNVLTVSNGTLNTGNFLTLKSNVSTTARVAPVTGSISGNVIVERYIPSRRAWRILSAPVGGAQTINAAWQEGSILGLSPNPNPFPGFGTHITGGPTFGIVANGFDQNPVGAMSSIKRYNSLINNWEPLQNTNATSVGATAYMTFVRGNRAVPIGYNDVPPSITTLRATGSLKVGDQVFPVSGNGFTGIPNPFASPINFATITRTGVQNNFYVWDPKMGGAFGVGAYVLLTDNGAGGYDIVPAPVSPESQYIQSGQGFLVRATTAGMAGSITIKESDKSATAATDVFRTNGNSNSSVTNAPRFEDPKSGQGLRINLQVVNADGTASVLDEVFSSYRSAYSDKIDALDAVKLDNIEENLGIVRENQTFMVERSKLPKESDIIELKLWNTTQKTYLLEFNPVNLSALGLPAFLEDKYLKTFVPVSLSQKSQLVFIITSDAASARTDRFRIVLSKKLPDVITTLSDKKRAERFQGTPGKNLPDAVTSLSDKSMITAYPNPINDRNLNLSFAGKPAGTYQVTLLNNVGQIVFRKNVQHMGGSATQNLRLDKILLSGTYQLKVINKDEVTNILVISN